MSIHCGWNAEHSPHNHIIESFDKVGNPLTAVAFCPGTIRIS